jgi:hypothetical protein
VATSDQRAGRPRDPDIDAAAARRHLSAYGYDAMSVVAVAQEAVDEDLRRLYRERLVAPRRRRLTHILRRATELGLADPEADVDYAVAACTGTLYSLQLAGRPLAKDRPRRTATLVWRAIGDTDR